jgi:hypothetical protein
MTNKDLSSIHRSPPSEPKTAASSLSAHVPVRSEKAVRGVGRKFTHTEVGASLPRFSILRSAWKGCSPKLSPEVATRHTKICRVAYMLCPVPALQFDQSSSRAPSVPPPPESGPAFLLPAPVVLARTELRPEIVRKGSEQRSEHGF